MCLCLVEAAEACGVKDNVAILKGLEPGMLRFISLPFNRIKYHSSRGLHPMSLCACLIVYVCEICLCVWRAEVLCVLSVLCQVGLWSLLW